VGTGFSESGKDLATLADQVQVPAEVGRSGAEDAVHRLVRWAQSHRQAVTYGVAAVVVAAGLVGWNQVASRRSEEAAGEQLRQARLAFEQENYPLAASEFARIRENYSGSRAAEQATLLLAQTRLLQGQAQQAVDVLEGFSGSASAVYRAQAFGLLGASYENAGQPGRAAEAFEQAARSADLPSMQAQFLSDAGRAWTAAADTEKAVAAYQRIVRDLSKTAGVAEATVRLGELTKGAAVVPAAEQ